MATIRVQAADFDPGAELAAIDADGVGGIGSFVGVVRGSGGVTALHLEHYPGMTERALHRIAGEAERRWPLRHCLIVHRHGRLLPGERIVLVAAASAHRAAALDATAFLIDQLKTRAPFWKREDLHDSSTRWVEARDEDDQAAARW